MLSTLKNLKGARPLTKKEKEMVLGGSMGECYPERPRDCVNGVKYMIHHTGCWVWFCQTTPGDLPNE